MKYVLAVLVMCLCLAGCGGASKVTGKAGQVVSKAAKGGKALKLPKGGKAPKLPKGSKVAKLKNEKTFGEHLKGKLKSKAEEAILDVAIEEQRKANLQSHYNSGGGRALIGKPVKTIVTIFGSPASWKNISYGYLLYTYNIEGPDSKGLRLTLKPDGKGGGVVTDVSSFYVKSSVPQGSTGGGVASARTFKPDTGHGIGEWSWDLHVTSTYNTREGRAAAERIRNSLRGRKKELIRLYGEREATRQMGQDWMSRITAQPFDLNFLR
jgi:hypothetical protein